MRFVFPYKFKGFMHRDALNQGLLTRAIKLIPLRRVDTHLGQGSISTFGSIYNNVLQAMADYDYEYLSNIMEPKLYKVCKEKLEDFQSKNYTLEYIEMDKDSLNNQAAEEEEQDEQGDKVDKVEKVDRLQGQKGILSGPLGYLYEERDLQMFMEARGAFGVHITRSKNEGNFRKFGGKFTAMEFYKGEKKGWFDMFKRQVLILDVYYYTSRKLVLKDEDGDVLEGSDVPKDLFDHKMRFETYTDKIDWVLCDIDEYLGGNPYVKSPAKEEKSE